MTLSTQALLFATTSLINTAWADDSSTFQSLVIITSDQYPVAQAQTAPSDPSHALPAIHILNLDAVNELEKQLSHDLPAKESQAQRIAEQRITQMGHAALNKALRMAYQPLTTAITYGIDRYPAMIFDQRTVIYGLSDIAQAIKIYREWRRKNHEGIDHD